MIMQWKKNIYSNFFGPPRKKNKKHASKGNDSLFGIWFIAILGGVAGRFWRTVGTLWSHCRNMLGPTGRPSHAMLLLEEHYLIETNQICELQFLARLQIFSGTSQVERFSNHEPEDGQNGQWPMGRNLRMLFNHQDQASLSHHSTHQPLGHQARVTNRSLAFLWWSTPFKMRNRIHWIQPRRLTFSQTWISKTRSNVAQDTMTNNIWICRYNSWQSNAHLWKFMINTFNKIMASK